MPTTHMNHCKRSQFNKSLESFYCGPGGEKIWFQGVKIEILSYKTQFL